MSKIEEAIEKIEQLRKNVSPGSANWNFERHQAYTFAIEEIRPLSEPKEEKMDWPLGIKSVMGIDGNEVIYIDTYDYRVFCCSHIEKQKQKIWTVQNSKGIEFSCGDETERGKILEIEIFNNRLYAHVSSGLHTYIDNLTKKAEKEVLFVTDDGVEITDYLGFVHGFAKPGVYKVEVMRAIALKGIIHTSFFSTKEVAEKHLSSQGKKEASVKEILNDIAEYIRFATVNPGTFEKFGCHSAYTNIKSKISKIPD